LNGENIEENGVFFRWRIFWAVRMEKLDEVTRKPSTNRGGVMDPNEHLVEQYVRIVKNGSQ